MAIITGTPGGDIITGTPGNDKISALEQGDRIIGSTGSDTIDGGEGFDTVDYSNLGESITVTDAPNGNKIVTKSGGGIDTLISIEKIVNLTGTEGADVLRTENVDFNLLTGGNDTVKALGGDDRIIGSTGTDIIDGGAGNDTLDFTGTVRTSATTENNFGSLGRIYLSYDGNLVTNKTSPRGSQYPGAAVNSQITNIETIIGDPTQSNAIYQFGTVANTTRRMEIDLAKHQLIAYDTSNTPSDATRIVNFQNFNDVLIQSGSSRIVGNDSDNTITNVNGDRGPAISDDLIIGSKGKDTLDGGNGINILDYSNLGTAVKVSLELGSGSILYKGIGTAPYTAPATSYKKGTVDKGSFGTDTIVSFEKIIGATNKNNTIDLTMGVDGASVDLNLATNSLKVNLPNRSSDLLLVKYELVNFVNAIGTKGNDTIVGANKNSTLTGGGGNDTITGGNKNDRITGTDSTARGVGEVDILTGGGGRDKFILGDKNGAYYVGNGNHDYAKITDFDLFKDSIDIGSLKNYSFALEGNNTIDLYSGKDVKTRDLIAKIQISGGISSLNRNSKSTMGADANLNAIVSKIDLISGSASSHNS
jgi:Ca2+-binding RTX toxin-like protein